MTKGPLPFDEDCIADQRSWNTRTTKGIICRRPTAWRHGQASLELQAYFGTLKHVLQRKLHNARRSRGGRGRRRVGRDHAERTSGAQGKIRISRPQAVGDVEALPRGLRAFASRGSRIAGRALRPIPRKRAQKWTWLPGSRRCRSGPYRKPPGSAIASCRLPRQAGPGVPWAVEYTVGKQLVRTLTGRISAGAGGRVRIDAGDDLERPSGPRDDRRRQSPAGTDYPRKVIGELRSLRDQRNVGVLPPILAARTDILAAVVAAGNGIALTRVYVILAGIQKIDQDDADALRPRVIRIQTDIVLHAPSGGQLQAMVRSACCRRHIGSCMPSCVPGDAKFRTRRWLMLPDCEQAEPRPGQPSVRIGPRSSCRGCIRPG